MHQIRITILTASLAFLVASYYLVRKNRLKTSYALLWVCVSFMTAIFAVVPGALHWLSRITGLYYITALLWVSFLFVLVLFLHFSTVVSRLVFQNRKLAERMAFLEKRISDKDKQK